MGKRAYLVERLEPLLSKGRWQLTDFGQESNVMGFSFPNDIYVGYIKVANEPLVKAFSTVPASKNDKVTIYSASYSERKYPEILENFGKDDIHRTGVPF
jgi:hypothetical protein